MANENSLFEGQPGVFVTLTAKEGMGEELFNLCLAAKHLDQLSDSDPIDWVLAKNTENPDQVVAFEFFRDEDAMRKHYADSNTDAETDKIMNLLGAQPSRDNVHIVASSARDKRSTDSNIPFYQHQPGNVLRMLAKPNKGQDLFELTTKLHYIDDPDGPVDWVLAKKDADPDTLLAMEFYRDQESMDRHFNDPAVDGNHDNVIDLLGGMPERDTVEIEYSNTFTGNKD